MKRIFLSFVLFIGSILCFGMELPFNKAVYLEKIDNGTINDYVEFKNQASNVIMIFYNKDTMYKIINDESLATTQCSFINKPFNCNFTAMRSGNNIIIDGIIKGKNVKKTVPIDDTPWYQSIELSFINSAKNSKSDFRFWIVSPTTGDVYKFVAKIDSHDTMKINNRNVGTVKYKVTFDDFRNMFWSTFYWFNCEDGVFLKFMGKRGLKDPITTIEYLRSE